MTEKEGPISIIRHIIQPSNGNYDDCLLFSVIFANIMKHQNDHWSRFDIINDGNDDKDDA